MRFHFVFNRYRKIDSRGEAPIHVSVELEDGTKFYCPTQVRCHPDCWDKKNRLVNKKDPNQHAKNTILHAFTSKMWKIMQKFTYTERKIHKDDILDALDHRRVERQKHAVSKQSFYLFWEKNLYRSQVMERVSKDTAVSRMATMKVLKLFKNTIQFKDITNHFIAKFQENRAEIGDSPNTIKKHVKNLRTMVKLAQIDGHIPGDPMNDPFRGIRVGHMKANKKFALTFDEFDRLLDLNYDKSEKYLYQCWKMFIFSCRTSLRKSDLETLEFRHIKDTPKGIGLLKDAVKASGDPYRVNLSAEKERFGTTLALDIIEEFKREDSKPEDKVFKLRMDESVIAACFREITANMKLDHDKPITLHIGRHTFATHMAARDVSIYKIMKAGGWRQPKTVMGYMDMASDILGDF